MKTVTLVFLAFVLPAMVGGLQQRSAAADTICTLKNTRYYEVQYRHTLENTGTSPVSRQDLWCPVPTDMVNQKVSNLAFNPEPTEFLVDNWGQRVAHYVITNMPGESTLEISWSVRLEMSDACFQIDPGVNLDDIPAETIQTYTADDEKYVLTSPVVQQAAAEAIGRETTLYGMVESIYGYVIDHLYYLKEDGWDDAPTVLARGNGSCSEYAYVTVALYRANGIPARLVGGTRNRDGGNYVDTVFHRAVEVYLPNYGWVPIDTDLGDTQGRPIFSRYGDHFTFQTSGGRSSLLRWDYRSRLNVSDLTLVERSAQWTVTEMSPDQPPILNAIGNKSASEGTTLTFIVSATSPDGDALTYSAAYLPHGASFNPATRTFSWTPVSDQAGVYPNVCFQVSDGSLTDSESITITVVNISARPDINGDGNVNVLDMIRIGQHWSEVGQAGWMEEDVKEDGTVNVLDATLVGQHWTG
jgi:transglutaminase-like putative cysteine protease